MGAWREGKEEREEVVVCSVVLPLRITAIRAATGPCGLSIAELGPCLAVRKKAHLFLSWDFYL